MHVLPVSLCDEVVTSPGCYLQLGEAPADLITLRVLKEADVEERWKDDGVK